MSDEEEKGLSGDVFGGVQASNAHLQLRKITQLVRQPGKEIARELQLL